MTFLKFVGRRVQVVGTCPIAAASLALSPTAPDLLMFSEPERSTRLSRPSLVTSPPHGVGSAEMTLTLKTPWLLLDSTLHIVLVEVRPRRGATIAVAAEEGVKGRWSRCG